MLNKIKMIIYLVGLMGAGKSFYGKKMAEKYNLSFYDLDALIEDAVGQTIEQIFATKGETYFREQEAKQLRKTTNLQNAVVACGGGTPCFLDNMDWINKNGVSIYLNMPLNNIITNILPQKSKRPLIQNIDDGALISYIENLKAQRETGYKKSNFEVSNELALEQCFDKILQHKI